MKVGNINPKNIINFWFVELKPVQWWVKDGELDLAIKKRFGAVHEVAMKFELEEWRKDNLGRLAEIIILDQFSRNIYRDQPKSFAGDEMARKLCKEVIKNNADKNMNIDEKAFLYMPFMHSEDIADHELAVDLYGQKGMGKYLSFEIKHKVIIERFGRYPHRNKILGRKSSQAEELFLLEKDSSF